MLHEEVAYLGMQAHWSYTDVMLMEHAERRQWIREIARQARLERGA